MIPQDFCELGTKSKCSGSDINVEYYSDANCVGPPKLTACHTSGCIGDGPYLYCNDDDGYEGVGVQLFDNENCTGISRYSVALVLNGGTRRYNLWDTSLDIGIESENANGFYKVTIASNSVRDIFSTLPNRCNNSLKSLPGKSIMFTKTVPTKRIMQQGCDGRGIAMRCDGSGPFVPNPSQVPITREPSSPPKGFPLWIWILLGSSVAVTVVILIVRALILRKRTGTYVVENVPDAQY